MQILKKLSKARSCGTRKVDFLQTDPHGRFIESRSKMYPRPAPPAALWKEVHLTQEAPMVRSPPLLPVTVRGRVTLRG